MMNYWCGFYKVWNLKTVSPRIPSFFRNTRGSSRCQKRYIKQAWILMVQKFWSLFWRSKSQPRPHGFLLKHSFSGGLFCYSVKIKAFSRSKGKSFMNADMWIQLAKEFQCHPSCHCRINPESSSIKSCQSFILLPFNCHGAINGNKRNQSDC